MVLGFRPARWVPADSLVWAKLMSLQHGGNMASELQVRGAYHR